MISHPLKKIFASFGIILILFLPVNYAEQFSYADSEISNLENSTGIETNNSIVASELVINVSDDGKITILNSSSENTTNGLVTKNTGEIAPEDDNICFGANSLSLGVRYYAYIDYSGDVDWHKWNLPSSGRFTVSLEVPSNKDYDLGVYTNCFFGSPICSSTKGTGNNEQCIVDVGSGGIYTKVYGYAGAYSSSSPYYIKGTFSAANQYDLVPGDFTITPSSPYDTDSITIRYRATNLGPNSITNYFNFKLYIDNAHYQTCNANNGLTSGSTGYCDLNNVRLSRGTHTLKNIVDADSNIAETNEGNNIKTQSLYVSRVDLAPGDFTVTPSNPSNADSITVRYRADSLGPDDITKSFNYKLYIDNVHKQTCNSNGAPAGTTGYCELSGISLTGGTHTLKNVVDADNQIAESSEGNNIKEQNLFVKDVSGVDLVPENFVITPSSPTEASSITIEYSATNLGPADITKYFNLKLYIDGVLSQTCEASNGLNAGYTGYCEKTGVRLSPGTHLLKNAVDEVNNIAELNEFNNIKQQNLAVSSACPANYPYYCPSANTCFTSSTYCDGRPIYNCQGNGWVCLDKTAVGTCVGDTLRCCPSNYPYYWISDGKCHTAQQPLVTCNVPDGSSSECDCDSNSECPSSHPFCEQNYPSPISDGYDACLSSQPQYCGNGLCLSGESYLNCPQDCTAPKGTINVNVYHSSNNNAISGAHVYSDNVPQGTTDSIGKKNFEASFGQRNIKVECPDRSYCNTKMVNVDGTEYVGFECNCVQQASYSNLRIKLITQPSDYPRGFPVANVEVFLDDADIGRTNQFGAIDIENILTGSHKLNIFLKVLEDSQDSFYTGGTTLSLANPYEERIFSIVKGQSPATLHVLENGKESFVLQQYNETNPNIFFLPLIYVAITIGGIAWDTYDYYNCLEQNSQPWQPNANNWNTYNCVTSTSMTPDQYNECVAKALSKNQNTVDNNCAFEGGMLALNFVPIAGVTKTLAKVTVKIGKAVRFLPHIDNLIENAYKPVKKVINGETFVEVTDNLNKGAKYVYKYVDNGFKVVDNVVGVIVNKITKDSDTWRRISDKIDNLLLNTKPKNVPEEFLENQPEARRASAVQGFLGEKSMDDYIDISKEVLESDGAEVIVRRGTSGSEVTGLNNQRYVAKYTPTERGIKVFDKILKQDAGEFDGLLFINNKPLVLEAKSSTAKSIYGDISDFDKFFRNKIETVEGLTGQKPEILLLIPKGEKNIYVYDEIKKISIQLSDQLDSLGKYLEGKGAHFVYDEFPATNDQFVESAKRIANEFKISGR